MMSISAISHVGRARKLPVLRFFSASCLLKQTHYDILEIPKNASLDEVKTAFYEKSKRYHPDRHHGNEDMHSKFIRITEAYGVLSDPEKRAIYNYGINKSDLSTGTTGSPHIVTRSKHYQNPYKDIKGFSTDWSDFYSTYGGGKADRDMKRDANSQFWTEYWEQTKKFGGGEMQDGLSPPPRNTVGIEMIIVSTVLIVIYVLGFLHSSSTKRSLDHDQFDSDHLKWLMAQKKKKE